MFTVDNLMLILLMLYNDLTAALSKTEFYLFKKYNKVILIIVDFECLKNKHIALS